MQKRSEKETEKNIENHQNKMTDKNNRKKNKRATRKKKYGNTKPLFVNNHPNVNGLNSPIITQSK